MKSCIEYNGVENYVAIGALYGKTIPVYIIWLDPHCLGIHQLATDDWWMNKQCL